MNFITEAEPDIEVQAIRMLKRIGRTKPTTPYHKLAKCESLFRCPWHHHTRRTHNV